MGMAWSRGRRGWSAVRGGGNVEHWAPGGHRDVRSVNRPAGCPDFPDYLLDVGIRAGSNRCSGESDETMGGVVYAHPGNRGSSDRPHVTEYFPEGWHHDQETGCRVHRDV